MSLDAIGWLATAVSAVSYLFREPATLRRVQTGACVVWIVYGLVIHSLPLVVANVIVGALAIYSSFALLRQPQEPASSRQERSVHSAEV